MKFGGTSMGSAERMCTSIDIIKERSVNDRVGVIVSAVGGISNKLQASITQVLKASQDGSSTGLGSCGCIETLVSEIKTIHITIIENLSTSLTAYNKTSVYAILEPLFKEYSKLLTAVEAFSECPESVEARIMGLGEQFCVPIMAEALRANGEDVVVLDSRSYIFTEGSLTEGDPLFSKVEEKFSPWKNEGARILLAAGFIASDVSGKPSLLGRNGSDFSAALMAMGLGAQKLEIWSDVDGIFTADPRIVSDAVLVSDISYEEAMELSFFGSKVLHPKTLTPIASRNIETWSLNSFNRNARGTRIASASTVSHLAGEGPVRGVTCLKDTSLVSVTGAGLKGKKGIAARIFQAVSRSGVSVLLITQSSSEYTISFCVHGSEAQDVRLALEEEFELEMREQLINDVSLIPNMAIVSIVGDGMKQRKGVAGTFFSALGFGGINIHAIAQGSSERSISTVVSGQDGDKAVKIAHRFFFNTAQPIEVFLFGVGLVGSKLLDQIKKQQAELKKTGTDLRVCGISNSKTMILSRDGLNLENWKSDLLGSKIKSSSEEVMNFVKAEKPLNPICVDCTAVGTLPEKYPAFFESGMHVVTPNKRANSLSMKFYHELRESAAEHKKRFLYETNVGAGLPVIDTFRNMLKSGDSLISFEGVMSGSLSYIFGRLDEGASFSQAVLEAKDKGFTEPDPRDDLSGLDVARKALIIAREAGFNLELGDVVSNSIFPQSFSSEGSVSDFLKRLSSVDEWFTQRISRLKNEGRVLRFAASIDGLSKTAQVGLIEVSLNHPLAVIKNGENAFVFTTKYYSPIPLVIRGYGAGADVTASGVFADILRTTTW